MEKRVIGFCKFSAKARKKGELLFSALFHSNIRIEIFFKPKVRYSGKKTFRCYAIKLFKLFVNIFFFVCAWCGAFKSFDFCSPHLSNRYENFQFNSIFKTKKNVEKINKALDG